MYLKQRNQLKIREAIEQIKQIASMKNCSLEDGAKREDIRLWAQWFNCYANIIEEALEEN